MLSNSGIKGSRDRTRSVRSAHAAGANIVNGLGGACGKRDGRERWGMADVRERQGTADVRERQGTADVCEHRRTGDVHERRGTGDVPWKPENEDVYRWVTLQGRARRSASAWDTRGGRASISA